jgi:hypothetical protein
LEISTCTEKNKGNILSTDSGVCAVVVPRGALPVFELVTDVKQIEQALTDVVQKYRLSPNLVGLMA